MFASRAGVRPTMVAGLTLLGSLSVVFAFATSVWLLDVARFGQGSAQPWPGPAPFHGLSWRDHVSAVES